MTELDDLSQQNALSGLPVAVVGSIAQAEEPQDGDEGINSSNYGGYFGLGVGAPYPAGSPTAALLNADGPAAFDQEAQIAASEFASLLPGAGGNTVTAEGDYQGDPGGGGSQIMAANFGEGPLTATPATSTVLNQATVGTSAAGSTTYSGSGSSASSTSATDAGLNLNPLDLFGIGSTISSGLTGIFKGGGNWLAEAAFAGAGILVMVLGIYALAKDSGATEDVSKAAPLLAAA